MVQGLGCLAKAPGFEAPAGYKRIWEKMSTLNRKGM